MGIVSEWLRGRVSDPSETDRRRRIVTMLVVDVALALVLVWMSLMVQDLGYRIDNTEKLIEKLDLENSELVAEVARETSPERLRRVAESTLGLRVPEAGQVMTVAQP